MNIEIAIVGAGPWGLAVLDRLVTCAQRLPGLKFELTLVDPAPPGPGVHAPDQPPWRLLNTPTGQVDSFSASHFGEPPLRGALSFMNWLHAVRQRPADPMGYRPRADFGAYLRHVFAVLRDNAPKNMTLMVRADEVRQLELAANGRVQLQLAAGDAFEVHHAFVCTGHGARRAGEGGTMARTPAPADPYPLSDWEPAVQPGETVGIAGLGLVAVDLVAALTEGRGGRFEPAGEEGGLRYRPSGQEPVMQVFSRTGLPFGCRPLAEVGTAHEPLYCTEALLAERRLARGRLGLQLEEDLVLALSAEMRAVHCLATVGQEEGAAAAQACRHELKRMAPQAVRAYCEHRLPPGHEGFDAEGLLMPQARRHASFQSFGAAFQARLAEDVRQACEPEGASPSKRAIELLRQLRPFIRKAVEGELMTAEVRRRFFDELAPRIAQQVAGPPARRGAQWLALMRCGLLRVDLGPAPRITRDAARGLWRAQSTAFDTGYAACLDHLVRGHAGEPALQRDGPGLLSALYRTGLCAALARPAPADAEESGLLLPRLDREGHPIDATGLTVHAVTVLGVPTEGVRYFNHYLPSPGSRAEAFERIQAAIDRLLDSHDDRGAARVGSRA